MKPTPKGKWHRRKYHANGELACDQGVVYGFPISWNPDDDRFYLHDTNEDGDTLATRKDWNNIVQLAKTLSIARSQNS